MAIKDSIKDHVLKLNHKWLEAKKKCFFAEPFYDPDRNSIYVGIENLGSLTNQINESAERLADVTIDKDFVSYCWDHYFPETIFKTGENVDYPIDGNDVSSAIVSEIEDILNNVNDVSVISKTIIGIIETIGDTIEELTRNHRSEEYIEVLDYFLNGFKKSIPSKYCHSKEIFDIVSAAEEKLLFDLNLDELAALLYILYRAEIIHTPTPSDTTFLSFCSKFFYFHNQKKNKKFTPASDIRRKFSDARNSVNIKALNTVIKKLKDSFESL